MNQERVDIHHNLDKALALIKESEGLRLEAYQDSGGIWTIAYGIVYYPYGSKVKVLEGDTCTPEQADEWLLANVQKTAERVHDLCYPVELTENQFNAVVSFVYNIGVGSFKESTMLKMIHARDTVKEAKDIAAEFLRWTKINGKESKGLKNRREKERALFLSEEV